MLLALTLAVGLPLVHANAKKSAALVPPPSSPWGCLPIRAISTGSSAAWSMVFLGRSSPSPQAHKWVFLLLVVVISAELVHLMMHYVFQTH